MKKADKIAQIRDFLKKNGVSFLLVIAILATLLCSLYTYLGMQEASYNAERVQHTYKVLNLSEELQMAMVNAVNGQRGYLLTGNSAFLEPYHAALENKGTILRNLLELTSDNAEQNARVKELQKEANAFIAYLQETIDMAKSVGFEQAKEMVSSQKGQGMMDKISQIVVAFQAGENKLLAMRDERFANEGRFVVLITSLMSLLIISIVILAIVRLNQAASARKALFASLDENNRKYLLDRGGERQDDEKKVVGSLIENLQNATFFIREIGKANFAAELAGMETADSRKNNTENLAGALLDMRDTMKQVAEEERIRNWSATGLAEFADALRANDSSVEDLSYQIISRLIKYIGANQGAIFLLHDEDKDDVHLAMAACYAFNRKKYLQKKIYPGEGLVGQAYLEKDTIYLTEVPDNYINITSGLGESNPRTVLIQPLMVNERIYGVIELASFELLPDYKVEFVGKVSESIASTISSLRINARTRVLLEQSQQQAEEMRAQEEEMRQNMEEMQATQEQQERLREELLMKEQASASREQQLLEEIKRLQEKVSDKVE